MEAINVNLKCICGTFILVVSIVCVTKVLLLWITNHYHKKLVLDEREKKDACEKRYFDKNRDEEIKSLKEQLEAVKREYVLKEKDREIEELKKKIDGLEKNKKKE